MPISERLIASQTVSLSAYQRLRETLMQQAHLFDSVTTEFQIDGRLAAAESWDGFKVDSFVLMQSATLNVLLMAAPVNQANGRARSKRARRQKSAVTAVQHQVRLTFDESAIAVFSDQLKGGTASFAPNQHRGRPQSESRRALNHWPKDPLDLASASADGPADEAITQADFMLNWAQLLTASPQQGLQPAQVALDSQRQQSSLLNQLIAQVGRGVDLPVILESAAAQVREILSADRIVLHQLEQLDGSETTAGSVTCESRISEEIPSVLHSSEAGCFQPSLSVRARYWMGAAIAVDNVDQQYAHADCLLDFLHQAQVKSKLIAPVIVQDRLWGLLIAHQCSDYRHWEESEASFLQQVAEHLAVAINQAGLYQQLRQQTVSLESCVIDRTQNLRDALVAAEAANVTKGEFLSTMSHELRTPLTYIIGMSATLLRWSFGALSDRQRSYLTTINQSGEQLLEIINNILEFAKVESGRSLLEFTELSLSQLIDTVISSHQGLVKKQGVTLSSTFEVSPDSDCFTADARRLQQIISNLLHNAIKFTPAGGQIHLRVWQEHQTTLFQIKDTGIGIPESQQSILFEKFKQLESPFQRQYSGTGLGLAMTKRLVELHGGSIQVQSQVGKGSTFTVRLPVQRDPYPTHRYQIPSTLEDTTARVILLEDSEESAAIVCNMLTAAGYKVIWLVEAGQLAMQLDSLRPVMLIADLALLSHDPNEVKAIQLATTAMNVKVLALLGQEASSSLPMAHHDILSKPIDPKDLLVKVRQLVGHS